MYGSEPEHAHFVDVASGRASRGRCFCTAEAGQMPSSIIEADIVENTFLAVNLPTLADAA